jgi:hypothetical protein
VLLGREILQIPNSLLPSALIEDYHWILGESLLDFRSNGNFYSYVTECI